MSPDQLDTLERERLEALDALERERREADRRYNDALTRFDAALLRSMPPVAVDTTADGGELDEAPAGVAGWLIRTVRQWLSPWVGRQQAFNARIVASLDALSRRDQERAAAFEQFQSALIFFLQQITAFVESKDRPIVADLEARAKAYWYSMSVVQQRIEDWGKRIEAIEPPLPELRTQIAVLRRAIESAPRPAEVPSAVPVRAAPASTASALPATSGDDFKYVAFEDEFRGSYENIAANLADYLPIFAGASDVVDLGCGRGEFLMALKSAGVSGCGVDTNAAMVAAARERGLDVTRNDALTFVAAQPDNSLGGAIATQVVEHLEPAYLVRLLAELKRALRPGAPLVLETINPSCWFAFFSSYIRDFTHVRPIHPETLQFMLRANVFERVQIRYRSPVADSAKLHMAPIPADIQKSEDPRDVAFTEAVEILDRNMARLNELAFGPMDYAVVGYKNPNDRDPS